MNLRELVVVAETDVTVWVHMHWLGRNEYRVLRGAPAGCIAAGKAGAR